MIYLLCYFLGTFPTGRIVGYFYKVDLTKVGSRNTGATNVARILGKVPGLLTLAIDTTKGLLAVYIAGDTGGFLAVLGHTYPPWLKGGKGVATALGVLLGFKLSLAIAALISFSITFFATKLVSLSSLTAVLITLFVSILILPSPYFILGIGVLIFIRHKDNIIRLLRGEESLFSFEAR